MRSTHDMCQVAYVPSTMAAMRETHDTRQMNKLQMDLGQAIRRLRKARGLSQEAVGVFAGIDQPAMSKVEKGAQGLSMESMAGVAKGLGVSISELWAAAEGQRVDGGTAVPIAALPKPIKVPSHLAQDIDALRYGQGAIAVALTKILPAVGERILLELQNEDIPQGYLEKEGSLEALRSGVESALAEAAAARKAKARKRPRVRGAG